MSNALKERERIIAIIKYTKVSFCPENKPKTYESIS